MRTLGGLAATLAVALVVTVLVLPVLAVLIRVPPGEAWLSDVALDALAVSARTNGIATALIVVLGTPAAWVLATRHFPGRALVVTLCEVPLVLPPAVAGVGLLVVFGRAGLLGGELAALGLAVPFTQAAVVLAVVSVAGPLYLRGALAAFEAVDRGHLEAARTLGAGPLRTFARVALPMASGGLTAAAALAVARGLGEFGATIIVAGSLRGQTQTLPLAVYAELEQDLDAALAVGGLLVVFALALLLAVKAVPVWRPSSTSSPTSRAAGIASPPA